MTPLLHSTALTDPELIRLHLDGDAAAFRRIVERYQGMVCALAYSACGDVARSEDLAQEVFITAWKQLPQLREPEKLRGWLGGITRNLCHNAFRRAQRTPTANAAELSDETPADVADPRDHAIGSDEAALMWSALAGLPENYREPMVLFYRQQQSVAAVAEALDISADTARQRLARGRALLTEQVAKLVAETLERSAPTPAFAGMVLAALPAAELAAGAGAGGAVKTLASAAAAAGSTAIKGGVAVKALAVIIALPMLMAGLPDYFRLRQEYEASGSDQARQAVAGKIGRTLFVLFGMCGLLALKVWPPFTLFWRAVIEFSLLGAISWVQLRAIYGKSSPNIMRISRSKPAGFEYRSKGGWLGLPWIHFRAEGIAESWNVARGWIAVGDHLAVGGLFAAAPLATAPLTIGGLCAGGFALGGLAFGFGAIGWGSCGYWASGGLALGWRAAQGVLAWAGLYAQGKGGALATHANDQAAVAYFHGSGFFRWAEILGPVALIAALLSWLPPLLLLGRHLWLHRRKRAE